MIKLIDKMLFKQMVVPFVWTFSVAVFVLLMQMMWLYIDDIIGKGISHWVILEVLMYLSVALFPLGFPIAILLSSIMVMGTLAERYELSSLKSAGISLLRIMRPMFFFALIVSAFSLYCANSLIPISNLKYRSRMYDIKKQKPALNLESGIFNYDFRNLVIYVNDKDEAGKKLSNVIIYDHKNDNRKYSSTMAESGELNSVDQTLVMKLYDGHQYTEGHHNPPTDRYPFLRVNFKDWSRIFDLSEFDLTATDENLFKTHRQMLSIAQLDDKIDSIRFKYDLLSASFNKYYSTKMHLLQSDSLLSIQDSIAQLRPTNTRASAPRPYYANKKSIAALLPASEFPADLKSVSQFSELLNAKGNMKVKEKLIPQLREILAQAEAANRNYNTEKRHFDKYIFEYHNRWATAIICLVFLFIGAPLGAIIRKGGFGYPMLIAIFFFVAYVIQRIMYEKLVKEVLMDPILAAWAPVILMSLIGLLFTYLALKDRKMEKIQLFAWVRQSFLTWKNGGLVSE